ncbi:MAG TPA: ATP-binding protein [Thiobacillaceae bacterium]|nr:ATP-binding protein [Thiobacillaceae bacterium]HNU63432.1 ATP-binding protein [Thiobacillaceae bacterium]
MSPFRRLLPRSLFGRTATGLLVAFLVFEASALAVVWQLVIRPLAERSADDLAAKIVLAAKTWVELPPETRADFEVELAFRHDLELGEVQDRLPDPAPGGFLSDLLVDALSRRTGQDIRLKRGPDAGWDWLEIQVADKLLRVGFDRQRYALDAPMAALGIFLLGAGLTVLTALIMVRQVSRRLGWLAGLAREVGQGRTPIRLPETGALELVELTAAFNRMVEEVQALLENRTVLLSGISHDLRTPITRMRLALSMLDGADADMVARMERDLMEMNQLIQDMLAFARALQTDDGQAWELNQVLSDLAEQARRLGPVRWTSGPACPLTGGEEAMRRIVGNFLDNARRYGGDQAVDLRLICGERATWVEVLDRGPGIPAEQREAVFRPFYRLEGSRGREGGGSGLGLAIARQLADARGWRIELAPREGGGLIARLLISHDT